MAISIREHLSRTVPEARADKMVRAGRMRLPPEANKCIEMSSAVETSDSTAVRNLVSTSSSSDLIGDVHTRDAFSFGA